jgi:hypothetical protein
MARFALKWSHFNAHGSNFPPAACDNGQRFDQWLFHEVKAGRAATQCGAASRGAIWGGHRLAKLGDAVNEQAVWRRT